MNWIVTENVELFWKTTFLPTSLRWNLCWKLRDRAWVYGWKWGHFKSVEWKEIKVSLPLIGSRATEQTERILAREARVTSAKAWRPRVIAIFNRGYEVGYGGKKLFSQHEMFPVTAMSRLEDYFTREPQDGNFNNHCFYRCKVLFRRTVLTRIVGLRFRSIKKQCQKQEKL